MTSRKKIRNLRYSKSYYVWASLFFVFLFIFIGVLYYCTMQIDYVWRWYRVPQYFFYENTIETKAEIAGSVTSITPKDGKDIVVVTGPRGEAQYETKPGSASVSEGDMIFMGDTLASHKQWEIGILLKGLWLTIKVSVIAIIFGILIGLFAGIARISENPALRWTAISYVELIRGSPLLVQIFIWYFVLGTLINTLLDKQGAGIQISPIWFGVAALAFFTGAYVAEMVRAGIQAIPRGQTEAAKSLGMNYFQTMYHIILPQAMRQILPPLAGQFISLIKDSSLLGIIAIRELTKATREVVTTSLQPFELWFVCALLYLVLTFSLSLVVQYLERRTQFGD